MRASASLIFLAAATLTVSSLHANEPQGDMDKLQGTWSGKVSVGNATEMTMTFDENKVQIGFVQASGQVNKIAGEFKLDPSTNPKHLDLVNLVGPQGRTLPPNLGIYKLEGDTLTVCMAGASRPRPTEFKDGGDAPPRLTTYKRVKEKAPKNDLARLQGTWNTSAGSNDEINITLTIKDKTYAARWDRGDGTSIDFTGEIQMNESPRLKTIDFVNSKRSDGGDAHDSLGIYTFDGDKIIICVDGSGNERPSEFKKGTDGNPMLLTLTKKRD